jgi:ABC-2 type transport system ATP-binding protein
VTLAPEAHGDQLLEALLGAGVGISRFELVEPSLQSIFIAKVGADAATAPASEESRA